MKELRELLLELLNEKLCGITISGPRKADMPLKIRIRPISYRGEIIFQAALWDGKQEIHKNYKAEELISSIQFWMEQNYRQLQAEMAHGTASVLVSKKGKMTIKQKTRKADIKKIELSHNRKKHYLLQEGTPVPFLVKLGVMTSSGAVVHAKYDKFRQINRFLEFIEDICPQIERDGEIHILDFGCGKSYLTFAMYHYLHTIRRYDVQITGLDLKEEVIRHCNELAEEFGYKKLKFLTGDIANYEGQTHVDVVVTLHACDTATDYALAKAVEWGAKVILSVPCCQHELNRQIHSEILEPVLKYGLLKERMAALLTDGLRASMLETAGYRVQVLEFIDMEHTPKNILLRGILDPQKEKGSGDEKLEACMEFLHAKPMLKKLLNVEDGVNI